MVEYGQALAKDAKLLQAKQQQMVQDAEAKVATAADAERAICKAMTTQVQSLRRQVADLEALQAENERLRAAVEVSSVVQMFHRQDTTLKLLVQDSVL